MTYHNAVKFLKNSPKNTGKTYDFERIKALCAMLGNPHKLINYVRLAGSNGKTVCGEMLSSALKASGYTVGCLNMPLRDDARQNIRIGAEPLSINDFAELCSQAAAAAAEVRASALSKLEALETTEIDPSLTELAEFCPTQNEMLLAVALLAFKKEKCDICIIECEHNGEDPTKFLPPASAVMICGTIPSGDRREISRIRSYIGKGIGEIVSVPQNAEEFKIISETCFDAGCRLTVPKRSELSVERATLGGTAFSYKGVKYNIGLCGSFQISNAIAVIEALEMLKRAGFNIPHDKVCSAFAKLKIACKFEVISMLPFIIADSTHTPIAINIISDALLDFQSITGKKIQLCLPHGDIADNFIAALGARGYEIQHTTLYSDGDIDTELPENTTVCHTHKSTAIKALSMLERDSLLFISGTHNFSNKIREEILAKLGY